VVITLALAGCATTSERYRLGSPERLADGKFRLVEHIHSGLLRKQWVEVSTEADGVLALSGPVAEQDFQMRASLGAVGPLLAQATLQKLGPRAEGKPVERRSVPLTVSLDLLLPAVGAAYALPGSPYTNGSWGSHWGYWVGTHALLDVLSGINLGLGVDYYRRGRQRLRARPGPRPAAPSRLIPRSRSDSSYVDGTMAERAAQRFLERCPLRIRGVGVRPHHRPLH